VSVGRALSFGVPHMTLGRSRPIYLLAQLLYHKKLACFQFSMAVMYVLSIKRTIESGENIGECPIKVLKRPHFVNKVCQGLTHGCAHPVRCGLLTGIGGLPSMSDEISLWANLLSVTRYISSSDRL
jgi:hypothetical protein